MESLLRLALVAATGAGIGGLERTGRRLAISAAALLAVALVVVAAICWFAAAAWYALLPEVGPAWAALIIGLALVLVAALIWAIAERRHRRPPPPSAGILDALPRAAAQITDIDLGRVLEKNAGSIILAAFAAGMFLNRRR